MPSFLLIRVSLLLAVLAGTVIAQSTAGGGSILGTVKDVTGAVLPDAKLSVLHIETGVATRTVSNAEGYFSTPTLQIGKYRVRVEATGMKAWEGELQLETGRIVELSPVLAPGQVSETITVTEAVPLVTTTDATDGSTLDSRRISELPVNGRSLNNLLEDVTPGLELEIGNNGGLRAGGMMTYATDYVQDGAAANNRETGGSGNLQGLESIGEVRIETSSSSAKYNRPASIIVTTKGGTNRVRGAVFETVRNNAFGVAKARQDVYYDGRPFPTPQLIRNEFGGSIGGPVFLPRYDGRNRTFFFVSREGLELRQGVTRNFKVPTAEMRNGDFSGLIDAQGRRITLYDPLTTANIVASNGRAVTTRLPFIGNQIPGARRSPLAARIYSITSMPSDITSPVTATNLKTVVPVGTLPNTSYNPLTIRLDHRISSNDNFFLKVSTAKRDVTFLGGNSAGPPTANYEANTTFLPVETISSALNWTHIFTPAFFVETSANRTWQSSKTVTGPEARNWAQELGLPNPFGEAGWPNITNVAFATYTEGDQRRFLRSLITNVEQNYNLILHTHNVQFGWRYHVEKQTLLPDQGSISGSAAFNSLATALESSTSGSTASPAATTLTGYDAANFYLGYAATYNVGLKRGIMRLTDTNYGLYLQDNYKVTNRLTLTPGIRWDINPAFTEKNNLLNAFDLLSHSIMLAQPLDYYYKLGVTSPQVVSIYERVGVKFSSAQELGKSADIFQSNYFDFGPRMGFAYRALDGRRQFIIRGGYGLYIAPIPMRTLLSAFSNMLPFRATYSYNMNAAAQSPDGNSNYLLRNVPTVVAGQNSASIIDLNKPLSVGRGQSVFGMGPLPSMKIHEWNLALEKQISESTVVRLRYNGKHGVNADQVQEINPTGTDYVWYTKTGTRLPTGEFASVARRPYDQTAYTSVRILQKTGYINTSTFTVEAERRFTKALGFQAFYTVTNALRLAGNFTRDSAIGSVPEAFLPGSVPADPEALNRFLNYRRDTAIPKHRVRWNWNYDLPFGRGRLLGRGAPKVLNAIIGGWKFSGTGTVVSTWYSLPTDNWGEIGNFEVYGKKYPILDCRDTPANATSARDERCIEGYLWYNGYISERQIDSRNAAGLRNGVFGLPADYHAAQKPVNPWPKGGKPGEPGAGDWDTEAVYMKLKDGATQRVTVDTGLHPWRNQSRLGPLNWTMDGSLLKFFPIRERMRLRVNVDMFNVFNTQGLNTPTSEGIVSLENSFAGFGFRPRQVQLTMRLEW